MPRQNRRDGSKRFFRVRVKKDGGRGFQSFRLPARSHRDAASKARDGRIVSVSKVSPEEILRIGEYFSLGDKLMKEFNQIREVTSANQRQESVQETQSRNTPAETVALAEAGAGKRRSN